ncbi:hypothetical protein F6U93_13195 [Tamlana haliotis]|uniref:Uncharacterized protein n=1 Tax=Pseudotamlana haliotis TaxID=2614804 RepID=A0A6N6MBB8_9FLAO|nr:hypothetical protein F6U93_13195 [Tamlana haliotis]
MPGLALNFTSTYQPENPRGISKVGKKEQLLIAFLRNEFYSFFLFGFFLFENKETISTEFSLIL